jgi:hypothetical protein
VSFCGFLFLLHPTDPAKKRDAPQAKPARLILTKSGNGIQIVAERRDDGGVTTPRIAGNYAASITVTAPELYLGAAGCHGAFAGAE